jgi:hypothetical protein
MRAKHTHTVRAVEKVEEAHGRKRKDTERTPHKQKGEKEANKSQHEVKTKQKQTIIIIMAQKHTHTHTVANRGTKCGGGTAAVLEGCGKKEKRERHNTGKE